MGLFKKSKRVNPKITTDGIEAEFVLDHEWWRFRYRDHDFMAFTDHLHLPSTDQLDGMIADVAALKPEMLSRLAKGWREWENVKMNDGESFHIDIERFSTDRTFEVCWADGASWGDMGIEFTIKEHLIVDEAWGD